MVHNASRGCKHNVTKLRHFIKFAAINIHSKREARINNQNKSTDSRELEADEFEQLPEYLLVEGEIKQIVSI